MNTIKNQSKNKNKSDSNFHFGSHPVKTANIHETEQSHFQNSCETCCEFSLKPSDSEKVFDWIHEFRPFLISLILAIIGFFFSISLNGLDILNPILILSYILYIISYLIASWKVIIVVFQNITHFQLFDENFLMFIATLGAIFTTNFPEAIAVMLFYRIGELVEEYSVFKSKKSIQALLKTRPEIAHVKTESGIQTLKPSEVCIGDTIIVKPGENIPLDGILLSERSIFDTSALSGESIPRTIKKNEKILSGMINLRDLVEIKVEKTFENSTIARILDLVQNAESNKSPTEKFITKFAKYYTPVVVLSAFLLALIPPLVLEESFSQWIYRSLIFLVISCPCALVLSIPLSYFGGIGGASKNGILVKGSQHLDALAQLKTIVFDKTGTITKGNFTVTDIITSENMPTDQFIELIAQAELFSNHPIAKSIVSAHGKKIDENDIKNFHEIPAHGIQATVKGKEIIAGSDKILHKFEIAHSTHFCDIEGTIVHVAVDRNYTGYLVIADEKKPDSELAMQYLRKLGIKELVMLSGDEACIVESLAKELGFDFNHSELLPEDKVNHLKSIHNQKKRVAFVGDGINDAPVLASADVGIAMGHLGTDVAIETADIVLMTDSLLKVGAAIQIARKTRQIIWENIILIFIVKVIFLLLGAFGLMNMWGAVFADVGMALIAIINARRILQYSPKLPEMSI